MKRVSRILIVLALILGYVSSAQAQWYDYYGVTKYFNNEKRTEFSLAMEDPYSWSIGFLHLFTLDTKGGWDIGYKVLFDLDAGEGVDVASDGYSHPQLMTRADFEFCAGAWLQLTSPGVTVKILQEDPVDFELLQLIGVNANVDMRLESPSIDFSIPFYDDNGKPINVEFSDGIYQQRHEQSTIYYDLTNQLPVPGIDFNVGTALGVRGGVNFWMDEITYRDGSDNIIGSQRSSLAGASLSNWSASSVTVAKRDYGCRVEPYVGAGVAFYMGVSILGFTLDIYLPEKGADPAHLFEGRISTSTVMEVPVSAAKTYKVPTTTDAVYTPNPVDPNDSGIPDTSIPSTPPENPVESGITVTSPRPGAVCRHDSREYIGWNYPWDEAQIMTLELWRDGSRVSTLGTANGRSETDIWRVDDGLAVGSGYKIKVIKPDGKYGFSGSFSIDEALEAGTLSPISTKTQFKSMSMTGEYYLACDIDFGGETITPLGQFEGTLDGRGHTIKNFDIDQPGTLEIGLFRSARSGAVIKNLTIENVEVLAEGTVGLVVGENAGTLENVHSLNCMVDQTDEADRDDVGGLVGFNQGTILLSSVTRPDGDDLVRGWGDGVGGIAGTNGSSGVIKYSWVEGAFIQSDSSSYTVRGLGGIAGYNYGVIQECFTNVTEIDSDENKVGGIAGENLSSGIIQDCFSRGAVDGDYDVGGITGQNLGNVVRCYATGRSYGDGALTGDGSITDSVWNTETSGQSSPSSDACVNTVGATTVQMQQSATYTALNWDFEKVWTIEEGSGFPTLLATGPASSAPSNLRVSDNDPLGVILHWNAGTDGNFHRVYRATESNSIPEPVSLWISETEFRDTDAIPGVQYWYTVISARNAAGVSQSDFITPMVSGSRPKLAYIDVDLGFQQPETWATAPGTANAAWSINGTGNYSSGVAVAVSAPGTFSISFADIPGWLTPDPLTISMENGATHSLAALYRIHIGSVQVNSSLANANEDGLRWRIIGERSLWREFGDTVSGVQVGTVQIEFNDVNGYTTPESVNLNVTSGQTVTITPELSGPAGVFSHAAIMLLLQ